MNTNIKIAKKLIVIAKELLAMSPHKLSPEDVIPLQGIYHNNNDDFDATVSNTDSRKINNEARSDTEKKNIPKEDIIMILKQTKELFAQSSFLDHRDGINPGDVYDRKRYIIDTKINSRSYRITYVLQYPKPNLKDKKTNAKIKLHHLYIDKQ